MRYNWLISVHASQAFSIAHCTDSEDLPFHVLSVYFVYISVFLLDYARNKCLFISFFNRFFHVNYITTLFCFHSSGEQVRLVKNHDINSVVSRPYFWFRSRSRSHSNWAWSRPWSHEVLVSVSYALVLWSQIDLVFLKCNDF